MSSPFGQLGNPRSAAVALAVTVVVAVVASLTSARLVSADPSPVGELTWTAAPFDSKASGLDGAIVPTGEILVQWQRRGSTARGEVVEFVVDGTKVDESCCSLSATQAVVPGGGQPSVAARTDSHMLDLSDGDHWITARTVTASGKSISIRAEFVVGQSTPTTQAPTTTAPPPSTTAPPTTLATTARPAEGTLVRVTSHGAAGDGATDDTAAIRRAIDAASSSGADGVHFPPGTYRLSGTIDIPDGVRVVDLADGAVVRQHGNTSAFQKVGDVRPTQYEVTDARRGQRTITVGSTSGLTAGDWFYFGSDDVFHSGKGYKRGFLRRIEAVSGAQLTLDRPLHHSLTSSPRGWEVSLAPTVEIRGGVVEQHDPKSKFYPILHLELVRDPVVRDTEVRNCGASGIYTLGTVGGELDAYIHDCLDDAGANRYGSGQHYGYGVEVTGPTRDLVVRGTSTRTRHAFTTNGAYWPESDDRLRLLGEPEDIVVSMDVWETTSSGLDTHEPGWNIQFRDCRVRDAGTYKRDGSTSGKEGGFGMFIRARGTTVENCVVERSAEDGLVVAGAASGMSAWRAADGPSIRNTRILDTEGKRGTHFYQPTHVRDLVIDGPHLVGMHMGSGGAGSTADTVTIDLTGYSGSFGVIDAEHLAMTNFTFRGVSRQYG